MNDGFEWLTHLGVYGVISAMIVAAGHFWGWGIIIKWAGVMFALMIMGAMIYAWKDF